MTTKTDEQERDAFEAACIKHAEEAGYDEEAMILTRNGDEYVYKLTRAAWWGYQAGRAALQSQDREDALRYRWLRDNAQLFSHFGEEGNSGWCVMRRDSAITRVFTYNHAELDEAIDHARRIEGGGNDI